MPSSSRVLPAGSRLLGGRTHSPFPSLARPAFLMPQWTTAEDGRVVVSSTVTAESGSAVSSWLTVASSSLPAPR